MAALTATGVTPRYTLANKKAHRSESDGAYLANYTGKENDRYRVAIRNGRGTVTRWSYGIDYTRKPRKHKGSPASGGIEKPQLFVGVRQTVDGVTTLAA